MASKIYTKKGDQGTTQVLGSRTRIGKCDVLIESIGTVDELNSYVGLIRSVNTNKEHDVLLQQIQCDLFNMGTCLADTKNKYKTSFNINTIEQSMDLMSKSLEPLKNFILPTGNLAMCYCHVSRTVCRRAERQIVLLNQTSPVKPELLSYINRLSDYFFVLARKISVETDTIETIWTN